MRPPEVPADCATILSDLSSWQRLCGSAGWIGVAPGDTEAADCNMQSSGYSGQNIHDLPANQPSPGGGDRWVCLNGEHSKKDGDGAMRVALDTPLQVGQSYVLS